MLEYKWTQLSNKCMHAVTKYFFTFSISNELYIFFKKNDELLIKLYQILFIYKKLAENDDDYLGWS